MAKCKLQQLFPTAICAVLLNFSALSFAESFPPAPKWQRFELTLKSSVNYPNALQDAEVRALFVSPLGETNRVYGFWDGGKTWRVRYQPNFPGRWRYYTMCSDPQNKGLNGQTGEFLCTAAAGDSRFATHGPIQVARDEHQLEHADRTPFLWLGDAAWLAAIKSTAADWDDYVKTRATQKFNVVQWRLSANSPNAKPAAFSGRDRISVNVEFFRQLDAKILAANRAGLLNAIAPLWEIGDAGDAPLPEDQAIHLFRYAVARWGADHVAWIVAFESDSTGAQATRWQNIGRAVFNQVTHAPVILLPGESIWALDGFRRERWVNVLGIQTAAVTDENSLPWLLNGPLALERQKTPARPLITIAPPAEGSGDPGAGQVTGDFARRLMWWSVLLNTPAGVSYRASEIADWNSAPKPAAAAQPWRQALSLPGASAIAPIAAGLAGKNFGRLELFPQALATQPGLQSPQLHTAVTSTGNRDMIMFYTPEERAVTVAIQKIPSRTKAAWLDPRTGESQAASGTDSNAATRRFVTPGKGDWLLVLQQMRGAR
jgi:hypothetical protein